MRSRSALVLFAVVPFIPVGCAGRADPTATATSPPTEVATTLVEPVIDVSPTAETELVRVAREMRAKPGWMVRLYCVPGGCTGIQNKLDLDLGPPQAGDATTRSGGVVCVFSRDQYPLIQGARIDYVTEGGQRGFTVTFPNQTPENRDRTAKWITSELQKQGVTVAPPPDATAPVADRPAEQP